ncbi:MAG: efflux RND transporter periplasmic adaptor subunit [Deltaproteobacteria bacterium]|nr:efflux RND transporter periplasmic adaptor subunit [Deltaproteobacteria bacterium]
MKIQVSAVEVHRGSLYVPIVATGTILPQYESRVGSKIAGRIEKIKTHEGDYVRGGEEVARIDQSDIILGQQRAVAELEMSKASLNEAKLNLTNLKKEKNRLTSLYERKVISEQRYDDVITAYSMALAKVDLASAQMERAKADIALILQKLKDSVVSAPFAGMVVKKYVNEGEIVSPGTPLVWIMNTTRVKAEVEIPEIKLSQVRKGIMADVLLDAIPDYLFQGSVSRINARINPVTRNFSVEIDIPNGEHLIKPGMFARITIKTDVLEDIVLVPQKALVKDGERRDAVFILKGERIALRPVTTGASSADMIEIRKGIDTGEKVIITGNYGLEEDTEVTAKIVSY